LKNPPNEKVVLPLSLSQNQIWLDQQSHPDSPHLNIGGVSHVDGEIDVTLFAATIEQVTEDNEALRLLPLSDGTQQLVSHWPKPLLTFKDFSDCIDPQKAMDEWMKGEFARPFTLDEKERPWCLALLKTSKNRFGIMSLCHHLVMDGYATALLMQKLSVTYNALKSKQPASQPQTRDYCEYVSESNRYAQSKVLSQDSDYWRKLYPSLPPNVLEKRALEKKTKESSSRSVGTSLPLANHFDDAVKPAQFKLLQNFAKSHGASTFHLYVAALAIYFCRFYNKSEIIIGVPVLNRGGKRYKNTLGMFVGVIPLRIEIAKSDTVVRLLLRIVSALRGAYRHSRYPLSALAGELQMMAQGQDKLFDVTLSYQVHDYSAQFGDATTGKTDHIFTPFAQSPLSVIICEFQGGEPVDVIFESSSDYFDGGETELTGKRINNLIMQMVSATDTSIDQLPILLDEERNQLIYKRHAQIPHHPNPQPFITSFEHQAALRPSDIAIRWQEGEINYLTVNEQANRLAHQLIQLGVQKDGIVAVVLPRQMETIMAFLAIAKAGGAFLPLDPDASTACLQELIQISGAVVTLIGDSSTQLRNSLKHPTLIIDNDDAVQYDLNLPASNPQTSPNGDDLAYLLFTSGSSGTPKGVLMEHAPLTRRLAWLARTFNIAPNDIALQAIQLTFDPAIIEIFLQLTQGACIALPPPGQVAPADIAGYAESFAATSIIFVPTTLRYFNQTAQNHPNLKLRVAISGGEVLFAEQAMTFIKHTGAQLYNLYGPTEACVFATAHRFDFKTSPDPLPIGDPVDDTRIYILDKNLQPLPCNAVGEIFIGGQGLAREYLNQRALTAQRFLPDPFVAGQQMYSSGDNGYWDQQGQIRFVGRHDNQIKLRGQRIEPGQIEAALSDLSFVSAAAVKKVDNDLHAWLVFNKHQDDTIIHELRTALLQKLPEYMVPTAYTVLKNMPHQISGKADYKALIPSPIATENVNKPMAPRSNLEKLLLNLFQDALPSTFKGVKNNFFDAGGDSLTALNLLSNVHKQIGFRLPLSILMQNPTVALLAAAIVQRHQPLMVNLSQHEQGTPIYIAASGHGDALRIAPLATAMNDAANLHMLQPPTIGDYTTYKSISELAEHYADLIEQRQHEAPPIITGFSVGGIAALETARRLVARGVPIGGLVLIDTTYPARLVSRPLLWRFCGWLVKSMRLQELSINQRTLGSLFSDPGLNGQIAALKGYRPTPLSLPATLVISSGFSRWYRLLFKPWHKLFNNNLNEQHLPGFHGTLFASQHIDALADLILAAKNDDR
jgi:amino acid adenylation domain-containing protein